MYLPLLRSELQSAHSTDEQLRLGKQPTPGWAGGAELEFESKPCSSNIWVFFLLPLASPPPCEGGMKQVCGRRREGWGHYGHTVDAL